MNWYKVFTIVTTLYRNFIRARLFAFVGDTPRIILTLLRDENRKLKAEIEDQTVLKRTLDAGVVLDENELWTDMNSWKRERSE